MLLHSTVIHTLLQAVGPAAADSHVHITLLHSTVSHAPVQAVCPAAADIHDPFTTVHEALRFSAHLRINGGPDNATVEQFVEEVMSLVELEPLRSLLPPHLALEISDMASCCSSRAC